MLLINWLCLCLWRGGNRKKKSFFKKNDRVGNSNWKKYIIHLLCQSVCLCSSGAAFSDCVNYFSLRFSPVYKNLATNKTLKFKGAAFFHYSWRPPGHFCFVHRRFVLGGKFECWTIPSWHVIDTMSYVTFCVRKSVMV